MIIKIIILIGLLKILDMTESPGLCASLYAIAAAAVMFASIYSSPDWTIVILALLFSLSSAYIYFWILNKLQGTFFWWLIAAVGLSLVLL